jgi:hypothetical protein
MRPEDQSFEDYGFSPPRLTPEVDIQPALLSFNPWIATENVRSS